MIDSNGIKKQVGYLTFYIIYFYRLNLLLIYFAYLFSFSCLRNPLANGLCSIFNCVICVRMGSRRSFQKESFDSVGGINRNKTIYCYFSKERQISIVLFIKSNLLFQKYSPQLIKLDFLKNIEYIYGQDDNQINYIKTFFQFETCTVENETKDEDEELGQTNQKTIIFTDRFRKRVRYQGIPFYRKHRKNFEKT